MRTASVAVVMWASVAWSGKTVLVAGGDCADPSLINGMRDFRTTASKLLGPDLLEAEVVLDIVRPRPTRSVQDIERQVESARALFYGGQGERALELIERALAELDRAAPEAKPWPVTQAALVLKALAQKNLEHPREMNEALRRIVRVDPTFKLDSDAHSPSTIAALDAVKREVARARKATLQVRVDSGPPATVFIDGHAVGATPLKVDLVPGTYRVSLAGPGVLSFPHRVELAREAKLIVDLVFEGSVGQQGPLCLSGTDDGAAVKLAQLVTAESVIVLRNSAKRGAPPYLTGSLYALSTAQQERSGSVQPELLSNLATFLVTGKEQLGVRRPGDLSTPELGPLAAKEVNLGSDQPHPDAVPTVDPTRPTIEVAPGVGWGRPTSFTLIGVGAASALAGIIAYAAGGEDRARFWGTNPAGEKLRPSDTPVGQEALLLMERIDGNRAVSFSLMGAGAGAALAGVVGVFLFPATPTRISVSPDPTGASVHVSGAF